MKNWTIAKRLIVGVALVTAITAGRTAFRSIRYHNVSNLALVMEHTPTDDLKRLEGWQGRP